LDLDPEGFLPQLQSPVEVGCALNLGLEMFAYDKVTGMEKAPRSWALVVSCLLLMGIDFQHISVVILKIWDSDQLGLAETLVTLLGSSVIQYCGLNPICPGGRKLPTDCEFAEECRQR
jgi:hypothetical protein